MYTFWRKKGTGNRISSAKLFTGKRVTKNVLFNTRKISFLKPCGCLCVSVYREEFWS